jgi:hypothetical protein
MKRLAAIIGLVTAASACSGSDRPAPLLFPERLPFVLSGTVHDRDGTPVSGAIVDITSPLFGTRTTSSADDGTYRFEGVNDMLQLNVKKEGYLGLAQAVVMASNYVLDITLHRLGRVISGEVFRGVVDAPPCDPTGWDGSAPCQRILYTPSQSGNLALHLEWTGPSDVDLLFPGGYGYWPGGDHVINASIHVEGGRQYEIRLHAYYKPVPFQLEVRLHEP